MADAGPLFSGRPGLTFPAKRLNPLLVMLYEHCYDGKNIFPCARPPNFKTVMHCKGVLQGPRLRSCLPGECFRAGGVLVL